METINRILPTYEIAGVPFRVDVDYNLLRHPEKQELAYRFFRDIIDIGGSYRLLLDRATLRALDPELPVAAEGGSLIVDLPQMVALDPEGMAEKYGCTQAALPRYDRDLQNNEDLLWRRQAGKPAAIMIGADQFFADTDNGYLVGPGMEAKDWLNVNAMPTDYWNTCYHCLYDPTTRKQYKPGREEVIPEGILALEIPHLAFSDSYNYRRLYRDRGAGAGLRDEEWFRRYPVRANMKARIISPKQLGYRQAEPIRGPDGRDSLKAPPGRRGAKKPGMGTKAK